MYNLLIAIAAGAVAFIVFYATGMAWWGATFPAVVALLVTYFVLARRTLKKLEALMMAAQRDLAGQRVEPALTRLRSGFELGRWQFLVASQIHAQLGMILYMVKRFDEAKPHLEKSFVRIGQARAMLGALHYMRKDYEAMERTFEEAVRFNKKDGLLWSVYAWCLANSGQHDKAVQVLSRAVEASPNDERLKSGLLALQNRKRLRLKSYGQEWWAFHLERPPADLIAGMQPGGRQARRGFRGYRHQ